VDGRRLQRGNAMSASDIWFNLLLSGGGGGGGGRSCYSN